MLNINQLTEQLRMLPDAILRRVAQMYKQDPYIFPMVISEGMARKKMRMAGQARAASPQPKVNDQAVAALGYTPEEAGISALQAPNMQNMADGGIAGYDDAEGYAGGGEVMMPPGATPSYQRTAMSPGMLDFAQRSEPVVRMAGGGVAHFREGGSKDSDAFERAVDFVLSVEGSDYVADDAGKGPGRFGILERANPGVNAKELTREKAKEIYRRNYWDAIGGDELAKRDPRLALVMFDAAVNHGVSGARQMLKQSGGDADKLLQVRSEFYDKLIERNPETYKPYAKGWDTRLNKLSAAVAGEPRTAAGQIPGQAPGVVAPAAEQEGFFSRLGSGLGMSEETKRNIGNILMAPTPLAPATGIPKAAGQSGLMSGLAGLAERIRGPQVGRVTPAQITEMQSAAQAAQAARATEEAAEAARMAGALPGEVQTAAQSAEAAQTAARAAQMPSRAERLQSASLLREGQEAARVGQVVSGAQQAKQTAALGTMAGDVGAPGAAEGKRYGPSLGYDWAESVPMDTKKDILKDVKQNASPETKQQAKKEGWTNDDWLALGFGLLANKSPYLSEALGTAGLGVLAARREREKSAREEAKELSEATYRERLGRKAEAEAAVYESGTRGAQAALNAANTAFKNWEAGLSPLQEMNLTEEQRNAKYDEFLRKSFMALGLTVPAGLSSQQAAMPAMPQGVKVRQTG